VRNASNTNIFVHHGSKLACPSSGVNGLICTGAGIIGIWVTYASSVTTYYADLTGNGLDDPTNGYAAFISRGCHAQFDRADFSNSAGGIRNARSIVTARQAVFDSIPNYSIWQFEQGFVNASAGTFTNCGTAVTKPVLVVGVSATRPQGGGTINAESCSFIGINGDIGLIHGGNGTLILDNITATGLVGKIAVISHGTLECKLGSITAAATNTQTELVLASRGAKAYLHGGVYNGSSAVRNVARFIEDSFGAVEGLTATNFTENNLARFEDSGEAYGRNSTVNGSSNVYARGTNANGEFVRYVDGKQECWRWLEVNTVASTKLMTAVWTFPVAFFNTQTTSVSIELSRRSPSNVVNTSTSAILPDVQIIQDSVSASVVSLQLAINSISAATFTAGNTVWVKLHAVGWWY
jgi:hypothetical protein